MRTHASEVKAPEDCTSPPERPPHPSSKKCEQMPLLPLLFPRSFRRTVRRRELHSIVPLADTTIYEMEQRGEFPRRFNLTARCVVWDLDEVQAWVDARKTAARSGTKEGTRGPDVRQRKSRPVRGGSTSSPSPIMRSTP